MLGRTQFSPGQLKERLAALAEELTALHRDLYWLAEDNNLPEQERNLGDLSLEQVMAAKIAVDNVRDVLWKYVDAVSKVEPQRVQEEMQNQRLRRVTQMLELLRKRFAGNQESQPVSFIEKINAAIREKLAKSDQAA